MMEERVDGVRERRSRNTKLLEEFGAEKLNGGCYDNINSRVDPIALKGTCDLRTSMIDLEKLLHSKNSETQLEATRKFRSLLTLERDALVQEALDRDVVPQLLEFLKDKSNTALQLEALWALTNVAAGTSEQTHLLIKNNAVSTLVSLLDTDNEEILEQAVWVLGNIAADGISARDKVLATGVMEPLLQCMKLNKKISFLRIATWTLSNLCDGQPRPSIKITNILEAVLWVLQSEDTEVLSHICWALSHLCDGPSPHIKAVVKANVCVRLVELLDHKSWRVVKPALRTVGNIVCAEDDQDYTQQVIECGAVPWLTRLIQHPNREIQKEACWTLSNIAAGTTEQIQHVLESGSIAPLVDLASKVVDADPDVKIEASWVLLNATSCGSDAQINQLVLSGCVAVLCNLLQDNTMVMMALEGLEKILQVGEERSGDGINPHAYLLDSSKVEELQKHRSSAISKRAIRMWKQYFVVCAICNCAYSKRSPRLKYCLECKCNVCEKCDCSIYHLTYQDQLWKSISEGEAEEEKAKLQNKKSKNKKKRDKVKQRKALSAFSDETSVVLKGIEKVTMTSDEPVVVDNYVDFLSNNGSILDLWKMMEDEPAA